MANNWPRRASMQQWTPAEHAIAAAVEAVEAAGCDVRLTDAVVLLQAARDSVADFVDGINKRRYVSVSDGGNQPPSGLREDPAVPGTVNAPHAKESSSSAASRAPEPMIAKALLPRLTRTPLGVQWDFGHGCSVSSSGGDEPMMWEGLFGQVAALVDDLRRKVDVAASRAPEREPVTWQPSDEQLHERLCVLLDDELAELSHDKESGRQDWINETQLRIDALKRAMELWPSPPLAASPAPEEGK